MTGQFPPTPQYMADEPVHTHTMNSPVSGASAAAVTVGQSGQSAPEKKSVTRVKRTRAAKPAADPTPDQRTINLTLPTVTYEWFEQQAAAAPFEPTLAKYLAWQLRELEKERRGVKTASVPQPLTYPDPQR